MIRLAAALAVVLVAVAAHPSHAAIRAETVEYKDGDQVCEGYLAWDDSFHGKRPGMVVVHDWMGLGENSKMRARQVAALGYVALAADIYGLDILAEDVEDETHNTTRFVVLARESKWAAQGSGPLVTSFVFRVRNLPAALYKAMGGFATNGVNMTKLESYMVDGNFFATQFYADVDGHPEDRNLAFALEELKFFSRELRIVGVYPGHPFRTTFSEKAE